MDSDNECSICLESYKLPYKLPCGHEYCYLCIKQSIESYITTCPLCRTDIPSYVSENAQLIDNNSNKTHGKWMYSGRNGGWWYYDPSTDKTIEDAYQIYKAKGGKSTLKVMILGNEYIIDFCEMKQIRVNHSAVRIIKRAENTNEDDLIKGFAGLGFKTLASD